MNDTDDSSDSGQKPGGSSGRLQALAARLNSRLESAMAVITPTGVVLGFLFPDVFVRLKPFIPVLFALITLAGSLKLRARDLGAAAASPVPVIGFFLAAHVAMPVVAFAASRLLLPADSGAAAGFVLLFSAPTAVSGFIWVSIYGGDTALALALILLDTLLAPLVMPFTTSALLGTGIALNGTAMALSLIYMVVAPTILGVSLNETSRGAVPRALLPYLAPLSKILLALVIAANTAAVAPSVDFSSTHIWAVGLLGIALSSLAFVLGKALGLLPGVSAARQRGLVFSMGMRNISAVATIAVTFFPEAAALPAVLGMVFQQALSAIFGQVLLGKPGAQQDSR